MKKKVFGFMGLLILFFYIIFAFIYPITSWKLFNRPTFMSQTVFCAGEDERNRYEDNLFTSLYGKECTCCGLYPESTLLTIPITLGENLIKFSVNIFLPEAREK